MALPKLTLGKVEEASELLQRLAHENTSRFVDRQAAYAEEHRAKHSRPLTPPEAAQIAVVVAEELSPAERVQLGVDVQGSDLRAYDEPTPVEMLLVAGLETAPAFLELAKAFLALIEMPTDVFAAARAEDALEGAIAAAVKLMDEEDVADVRDRARVALDFFAEKTGATVPKLKSVLARTVLGPLQDAMRASTGSRVSSLISSAASTPASPGTPSSTSSPTETS